MRHYKFTLTLRDFSRRLSKYPPGALLLAMRALETIEFKNDIQYEPSLEDKDAARKELLIAGFQEMNATKPEIAELLKRAGFE
jgi:hypothetical protein